MNDELTEFMSDNQSGARVLLQKAARILMETQDPDVIDKIRNSQPDMAPIINLCRLAEQSSDPTKEIQDFVNDAIGAPVTIAHSIAPDLPQAFSIMTYSNSSTVKECILELKNLGKEIRAIVPESRPGFEGRTLSRELGKVGIETSLVTEAAAFSMIPSVDYIMIGADRVTPPFFVNKIGTRSLAILANHYHVPVYLLVDRSKFLEEWSNKTDLRSHDGSEVCEKQYPGVSILNPYFEEVPLDLITRMATN